MANFWDFESRDTYNKRRSESWARGAREDAFELLGRDWAEHRGQSKEAAPPLREDNQFADW